MGYVFEDLTGQKFSNLTVMERIEDRVYSNGEARVQWLCKCECGGVCKATSHSLKQGNVKSCGCLRYTRTDLTGQKFGRLTVLNRNNENKRKWDCMCECNALCTISRDCLISGKTRSCGCLRRETTSINHKKYNDYEIQEDYVIMYTPKDSIFLVDLEDFWKIKNMCWNMNPKGYIEAPYKDSHVLLHRFLLNAPDNLLVDHVHGDDSKYDNRRYNIRLATNQENCRNHGIAKDNKTGVTGVNWSKAAKKWRAYIGVNGKNVHLGTFMSFEDAVNARKEAERNLFGEFSRAHSQTITREEMI